MSRDVDATPIIGVLVFAVLAVLVAVFITWLFEPLDADPELERQRWQGVELRKGAE